MKRNKKGRTDELFNWKNKVKKKIFDLKALILNELVIHL